LMRQYQFGGVRAVSGQALQWPRVSCLDPDADENVILGRYVPSNVVPKGVSDAACEMARELLVADRRPAPAGEGLKYEKSAQRRRVTTRPTRRPGDFAFRPSDAGQIRLVAEKPERRGAVVRVDQ